MNDLYLCCKRISMWTALVQNVTSRDEGVLLYFGSCYGVLASVYGTQAPHQQPERTRHPFLEPVLLSLTM